MKTLSNAELQDAIRYSTDCVRHGVSKSNEHQLHLEHLVALLDEQRRRASERVELTLEPMTTTLERAEFDARVEAQDGPEWSDWIKNTGVQPVGDDEMIHYKMSSGREGYVKACHLLWDITGSDCDVVAYQIKRLAPCQDAWRTSSRDPML